MQPSPLLARSLMADQTHCPLCRCPIRRGGVWCHTCYNYFHVKCSGLAEAKEWNENFSCKSCSDVTAATETAIATPVPHNDLTVPDTVLIDPATSHAFERSVAPSDNFWDNFKPRHAKTVSKIDREVVTWKPSFLTLSKNNTGEQLSEALHSVLSPIAVNTDRSVVSLTLCMILPQLTLSRTKNRDDGSNNKTIKRRLRGWHSCNFSELFYEEKAIQMRMNSRNKKQHSDLKMFNNIMSRGKISNAIRVLLDEHKGGVLAPTNLIDGRPALEILRDKHPEGPPLEPNCIQSEHPRTLFFLPPRCFRQNHC